VTEPTGETPLEELFAAYWDGTLTGAAADEFGHRLATDPRARAAFEMYCLTAVIAADLRPVAETGDPAARRGRWSRRRVLGLVGGALAAGLGGVGLVRWLWPADPAPHSGQRDMSLLLRPVRGTVTLTDSGGRPLPADGSVPPGATLSTSGPAAAAVLLFPNGTNLALAGEAQLVVGSDGNRVELRRGVMTADVRNPFVGLPALTLATAEAVLSGLREVLVTIDRGPEMTEVGVQAGLVSVAAPTGRQLDQVREGEMLTVSADGHRKQPIPETPMKYDWDLRPPLPPGWAVGSRVRDAGEWVVKAEAYPDPYWDGTRMFQIRSHQTWARGFFRLEPESTVSVRYRVKARQRGQVCFCVRTGDPRSSNTAMLEWNGDFLPPEPGQPWRALEVRAGDMLRPPNRHAPAFDPPWVGFLVIFNTFTEDVGLVVSEFGVSGPDRPVPD
jgi:ferric-dicitrate binding protein FerR (iron transport regulator)